MQNKVNANFLFILLASLQQHSFTVILAHQIVRPVLRFIKNATNIFTDNAKYYQLNAPHKKNNRYHGWVPGYGIAKQ